MDEMHSDEHDEGHAFDPDEDITEPAESAPLDSESEPVG